MTLTLLSFLGTRCSIVSTMKGIAADLFYSNNKTSRCERVDAYGLIPFTHTAVGNYKTDLTYRESYQRDVRAQGVTYVACLVPPNNERP